MNTDFDFAICGAGPVGLALAALLVKRGVTPSHIALFDAKTLEQASQDPRSIALSYGSQQMLQELGAWPIAAMAIHQIHVSRRGHFGRTFIDRAEYQLPALGYVTRYGSLVAALARAVTRVGVNVIRPVQMLSTSEHAEYVECMLDDGRTISTGVLVQAEGGVFSEQIAKRLQRDYEQIAIVAHVRTSAPIAHRAFERFTDEGPLALLPQDDGYALVWCTHPTNAAQLTALTDADFLRALEQAFGGRLGRFIGTTKRNQFPLGLNAHPVTSARSVAIGNAAQTLHPVAGQGLNLGLRDASVLARLLISDSPQSAIARFAETQQLDRKLTIRLTDTMARAFASAPSGSLSQSLLGFSLGLIDAFKPAKRLLAEQMMFGLRQ